MKRIWTLLLLYMTLMSSCEATNEVWVTWHDNDVIVKNEAGRGLTWDIHDGTVNMVADTTVRKGMVLHLSGDCPNGRLRYRGSHRTQVCLEGLTLRCDTSYALQFVGKKSVDLVLATRSTNTLGDGGIKARGNLCIEGEGELTIEALGNGHKGITVGGDLNIKGQPVIRVSTKGEPLERREEMPPMMGGPDPQGMTGDSLRRPMPPMMGGGGPQGMGMPPMMGGPERYDYKGATKAIKVKGSITIDGGSLTLRTSTPGAEGLEAKDSLCINGGTIDIEAYDDGISVGRKMVVNGGTVCVLSTHNDGIDVNGGFGPPPGFGPEDFDPAHPDRAGFDPNDFDPSLFNPEDFDPSKWMEGRDPTYIQTGGDVKAKSTAGPPEEGLDTDEVPILHTGGTLVVEPNPRF